MNSDVNPGYCLSPQLVFQPVQEFSADSGAAPICFHGNVVEFRHYGSHRRRDRITHHTDSRDSALIVGHPDKPEFGMFEKEVERIVETLQSEIAVSLAAGEVVFIGAEKITQHVKRVAHVGGAHLSTTYCHRGFMMPLRFAIPQFPIYNLASAFQVISIPLSAGQEP